MCEAADQMGEDMPIGLSGNFEYQGVGLAEQGGVGTAEQGEMGTFEQGEVGTSEQAAN